MEIGIPQYSDQALNSYANLMQSVQDINIYVEDSSLQYVYNELFERLNLHNLKFVSVMPLAGRAAVIERAEKHMSSKPTCYFIDGDLLFAANKHRHENRRVYTHECYCFENYFIDEELCCEEIHDELGNCSRESIIERLNWKEFIQEVCDYFVPLFEEYALVFLLGYKTKLTNRGIGCVTESRGGYQCISPEKIENLIEEIDANLKKTIYGGGDRVKA